jgi:hypothetical protein
MDLRVGAVDGEGDLTESRQRFRKSPYEKRRPFVTVWIFQ